MLGGAALGVGVGRSFWHFPSLHQFRTFSNVPVAALGLVGILLDTRYTYKECARRWDLYKNPQLPSIETPTPASQE